MDSGPSFHAGTAELRQISKGIALHTFISYLKVKMGAGGAACRSYRSYALPFTHRLANLNENGAQVSVESLETIAMVNDDILSVAHVAPSSYRHIP